MPIIDYFTFRGPQDKETAFIEAFSTQHGYKPLLPDEDGELTIDNPESRKAFSIRMVQKYFTKRYESGKAVLAGKAARDQAINDSKIFTSDMEVV
jgi:hypothetical protein